MSEHVRVGVGVIAMRKDTGQVLLSKRLVEHMNGMWSLPGGHIEVGESIYKCAARELLEETGLILSDIDWKLEPQISQDLYQATGKHYLTFFISGLVTNPDALHNPEPHKHTDWEWFTPHDWLPENLEPSVKLMLRYHDLPEWVVVHKGA